MLPGVGIFGSDPVCKVLIQILKHFDFEINAIWTNFYEFDAKKLIDSTTSNGTSSPSIGSASSSSSSSTTTTGAANKANNYAKLITTSIDSVLLNKNVNLVFVCCQPNLHSQISTKALGIGKNVICLFPTCKNIEDIEQMIQSARYYPSLMSSVNYGGLKYLAEFRLVKQSLPLIGELKVCNINISCQNLAVARGLMYKKQQPNSQQESQQIPPSASSSISNLIDHIAILASGSNASASLNWLIDKDLGAGLLNRFGAAMISLVLNLFDDKKCTRVLGSVRTFLEDIAPLDASKAPHAKAATNGRTNGSSSSSMRKITADDFCTFQMNLEPGSVLVNVTLNSLTHSKYSQELLFCGTKGILAWSNSRIVYRSTSKDSNNNISPLSPGVDIVETELHTNETVDKSAEVFLNSYKNMEDRHPELPLIFIRGLYHYLEHVKKEFVELDKLKQSQTTSSSSSSSSSKSANTDKQTPKLENFEHTRIVQMIVKSILTSSNENRWVTVNY